MKDEIYRLGKKVDFNNLIYHYKGKNVPKYFIHLKDPIIFYRDAKNGRKKKSKGI